MSVSSTVRAVFGHFQNLNLRVLLEDLRAGRAARRSWSSGEHLCPIAHGVGSGTDVQTLSALGQTADFADDCDYAARRLGADPGDVLRFVRYWDLEIVDPQVLVRELEAIWNERLVDAEAMQAMLSLPNARCADACNENVTPPVASPFTANLW